jgi:tetratricopeptide (TPR) repeat protein
MKSQIIRLLSTSFLASAVVLSAGLAHANKELTETVETTGLSGSYLAAQVAIDDNDDDAAVQFLERALALDPEDIDLKQKLFVAYVSNGKLSQAAELARNTPKLGNSQNLAGYVLASQAMRKRSWNNAISSLKEVAGVDLDKTLREITHAWALQGLGKTEEALARIDDLEGPEWISVMKNYHSGLIANAGGEQELAAKKFQAVIDNKAVISILTETYIRAVEAMVRNRSQAGDKEKARETLDYGLSLLPSHSPFTRIEARLDEEQILKPILSSPSQGMAELFYNIATAIRRDGASSFSKNYLQIANSLAPKSDVIQIALAELYLQQGDYEKSNSFYTKLDETSPFFRIARLEKATNLSRLEKKEEAIAELKSLIESDPNDLTGYMTLGSVFSREERYREAADVYDKAVEVIGEPKTYHWSLFFRRGIAYERLKEWEKAEPNFKKSLELSANQAEVLNYLGYSWIDQGINLDEGMDMIRKAVNLRPRSGFIVDSLGWAHYRLGQYEDAVRELEKAVQLMPQDPTINDHLGDAYWKVGRRLEATFQWKIALASKTPPDNPEEIKKKLEDGLKDEDKDATAKAE